MLTCVFCAALHSCFRISCGAIVGASTAGNTNAHILIQLLNMPLLLEKINLIIKICYSLSQVIAFINF